MKKLGICLLILCFGFGAIGCAGKTLTQIVTGACDFLNPYMNDVNTAWTKIRADYPKYEAVVTGKTNALASQVVMARAWIAAADEALAILGAVVNGVCRSVQVADVQKALAISNETLPKTAIAPAQMKMLKVMK